MILKSFRLTLCFILILFLNKIEGQTINNASRLENGEKVEKKSFFNIEEIKVRWKKAALENCSGVPCIVTPPAPSFTCGTSTISDIDNNAYSTVLIGTQCWTKENLRVRKYNDGSEIKFDTSGGILGNASYSTWSGLTYGAYTLFAHDSTSTPSNLTKYGYLYNQYAVLGIVSPMGSSTKNICPTGWHVPSVSEWRTLSIFIDPTANTTTSSGIVSNTAGGKLKSSSNLWTSPGTDDFRFSALPGGERKLGNTGSMGAAGFNGGIGTLATFWTSTMNIVYKLDNTTNGEVDLILEQVGTSIRCLKD